MRGRSAQRPAPYLLIQPRADRRRDARQNPLAEELHSNAVRFGEDLGEQRLQHCGVVGDAVEHRGVDRSHAGLEVGERSRIGGGEQLLDDRQGSVAVEHRGEQAFAVTERRVDGRGRAADATGHRLHRQRRNTVGDDQFGRRRDRPFANPDSAAGVPACLTHGVVERAAGAHPPVDGRAGQTRSASDPIQRKLGNGGTRRLGLGHRGLDDCAVHDSDTRH